MVDFNRLRDAVLQAQGRGLDLKGLMEALCREVEQALPGIVASVTRVDELGHLWHLAAPSLSAEHAATLRDIPASPYVGSSPVAAYTGLPCVIQDLETHPNWIPLRHLVRPLGLRSCLSLPIKRPDNDQVVGTFALFSPEPGEPGPEQEKAAEACLHIAINLFEIDRLKQQLEHSAFFDVLTGLPNRSALIHQAATLLAEAERQNEAADGAFRDAFRLAVVLIDLDNFKGINDTVGHAAGDSVLKEVGRRLRANLRQMDLVGRLGSDEFLAVLRYRDTSEAMSAADRVIKALREPFIDLESDAIVLLDASLGISLYPGDGRDMDTLIRQADLAMSQAKMHGRGKANFYNQDLDAHLRERFSLERALREAVYDGKLSLSYQPKIKARSGLLHGVEALVRWHHEERGWIPPDQFIPLAEQIHLVSEINAWVINEACRQFAQWRKDGIAVPHVAVNVSAPDFKKTDFSRCVGRALDAYDLQPCDIVLELTESIMLDPTQTAQATIQEIHGLGVMLSLDDFGTGYSSLSHLHRLPIRELKIDRSFILDIEKNPASRTLTQSIIHIGRSLGMTTVAEGVETGAQRDFLIENGCDVLQGYLYARPMMPEQFSSWIKQRGG